MEDDGPQLTILVISAFRFLFARYQIEDIMVITRETTGRI